MKPAEGDFPAHRIGDIWAAQQLGVDDEPVVLIEYGSGGIAMRIAHLLAMRGAIDELIEVLRTKPYASAVDRPAQPSPSARGGPFVSTLVDVQTPEPDTDAMSDDPTESNPDLYKIAFENERVRVLEYRDAPGDRTTPHSHPDSVMVTLADFDRKLIMGDQEREMSLTAGRAVWIPAQSHAGENVGTTPSHSIFVELKEPDSSASTGSPPRPRTDRHWNESPIVHLMKQLAPFLLVGLGLAMILLTLMSLP